MEPVRYNYIICLDHFDGVSDEYKQKFWDMKTSLTFVTANRELYKDYGQKFDKLFVDGLAIPRTVISVVLSGDGKVLREGLYNCINIAKEHSKVVIIFDMSKENEEDVYYSILDSLSVLEKENITFNTYNEIYGWQKLFIKIK